MQIGVSKIIALKDIELNDGQIEGLPKNPRFIRDAKFQKLKKSIEDNPEMLSLRELLVFPHEGKYVLIGGNMRYRALKDLRFTEAPCKLIPADATIDQLKAYTIKDNAGFGEWDFDALANDWDSDILGDWGVDLPVGDIGKEAVDETVEDDFDESKDDVEVMCKKGDVWQLGEHRLMCGDSTDAKDFEALMGGGKADLLLTDPPYGVSYSDKNVYLNAIAPGNRIQTPIENDNKTEQEMYVLWRKVFKLAYEHTNKVMSYYVFSAQGGELLLLLLLHALKDNKFTHQHNLVWVKNNHVLGRSDYNYKHEPITYGWKQDGTHNFYARFDTSVFEDNLDVENMKKDELVSLVKEMLSDKVPTTVIREDKPLKSDLHPTMKPVPLFGRLIKNSTRYADIVLDPFGGSGTTLIAAEQLGRKAYLMELDPHYCDVIIARWEKFTGKVAVRLTNINETNDEQS